MRILINIFAGLMLIGSLTVSCNGCERKTTEITTTQQGMMADSIAGSDNAGDNYRNTSNADGSNESGNTGKATRTGSGSTDSKTGSSSKKSGYSAANGTDAENHDGDPYTKHDTTSMPTGTSIR